METLFRWLAGLLAGILEKYADPMLEARLNGFNARVKVAEADEQKALEELANRSLVLDGLKRTQFGYEAEIAKKQGEVDELLSQLDKTLAAAEKVKADLAALPADKRVRLDL